jgi:RecJ-like exonuclease
MNILMYETNGECTRCSVKTSDMFLHDCIVCYKKTLCNQCIGTTDLSFKYICDDCFDKKDDNICRVCGKKKNVMKMRGVIECLDCYKMQYERGIVIN